MSFNSAISVSGTCSKWEAAMALVSLASSSSTYWVNGCSCQLIMMFYFFLRKKTDNQQTNKATDQQTNTTTNNRTPEKLPASKKNEHWTKSWPKLLTSVHWPSVSPRAMARYDFGILRPSFAPLTNKHVTWNLNGKNRPQRIPPNKQENTSKNEQYVALRASQVSTNKCIEIVCGVKHFIFTLFRLKSRSHLAT